MVNFWVLLSNTVYIWALALWYANPPPPKKKKNLGVSRPGVGLGSQTSWFLEDHFTLHSKKRGGKLLPSYKLTNRHGKSTILMVFTGKNGDFHGRTVSFREGSFFRG